MQAVAKAQNTADDNIKDSDDDESSEDADSSHSDVEHKDGEDSALENAPEDDDIPAPSSWTPAATEKWKDVPREAKQEIARRERELLTAASKHAQLAHDRQKHIEQLEQRKSEPELNDELKQFFAKPLQQGQTVEHLLTQYANVVEKSHTMPGVFSLMAELAGMHGLSPVALVDQFDAYVNGGNQIQSGQRFKVPEKQQNDPLRQEVEQIKQQLSQGQHEQQRQQVQSVVDHFKFEKDESGQAKRPFFEEIEGEIASAMQVFRQQDPTLTLPQLLAKGYEYAVYGNPTTRRKMEALQRSKESQKRQGRVHKAQQLSVSSPTGNQGGVVPVAAGYESYEDSLKAVARERGII